jgi:hypothetical protein
MWHGKSVPYTITISACPRCASIMHKIHLLTLDKVGTPVL